MSEPDYFAEAIGLIPKTVSPQDHIDSLAEELLRLREIVDATKEKISKIEDEISYMTEEEPGTTAITGTQYDMFVDRSELWSWDSDILESKVGLPVLPDFITMKLGISRTKFQALSSVDQAEYMHALTRKCGSPRIKVQKKK